MQVRLREMLLTLPVFVGVMLAGFLGMVDGMDMMTMGDMRVMPGALMIPGVVMVGGCPMVAGGVFMMFGGFAMMLSALVGHRNLR
jgi:hypothetical protein